jgi:excisionase family DNA binding protein
LTANFHELVYTVAEACAAARAGRTAIYEAIAEGALTARKRGRKTLILAEDLRRWVGGLPAIKPKSSTAGPAITNRDRCVIDDDGERTEVGPRVSATTCGSVTSSQGRVRCEGTQARNPPPQ